MYDFWMAVANGLAWAGLFGNPNGLVVGVQVGTVAFVATLTIAMQADKIGGAHD